MKNSRKMRGLLVMLIAFAFCFLAEPVKADDRTALDGIYVEDISVGGMTEEQITQAVNDKIEQLKPSVINLSAGEQNAQVTAGDLGLFLRQPGGGKRSRHNRAGRQCTEAVPDTEPAQKWRDGDVFPEIYSRWRGSAPGGRKQHGRAEPRGNRCNADPRKRRIYRQSGPDRMQRQRG